MPKAIMFKKPGSGPLINLLMFQNGEFIRNKVTRQIIKIKKIGKKHVEFKKCDANRQPVGNVEKITRRELMDNYESLN